MQETGNKRDQNLPKLILAWRYLAFVVFLVLLPLIFSSAYVQHVLVLILLFAFLGEAWDILGGFAGQLSLGHAIYLGGGAYVGTILNDVFHITPWIGMPIAGTLAAAVSFVLFYPTFRFGLRGPYFTLATIGIGEVFVIAFTNIAALGGAQGLIVPIRKEGFFWIQFLDQRGFYYVVLFLFLAGLFVNHRIRHSKMGYQLLALREDEAAAEASGVDVRKRKMQATMISAFLTAVGGVFYAQLITFIDPPLMGVESSISIILGPVAGGSGTLLGPLVGAAFIRTVSESIRFLVGANIPGLNMAVFGGIIVLVVLAIPDGILPAVIRAFGFREKNLLSTHETPDNEEIARPEASRGGPEQ